MKRLLIIIGLLALSFVFLWKQAYSYTNRSYDVYTLPEMYLNEGITATQTTGITIAAPKLNGDEITVNGMSGAIFEFRRAGKKEDIYTSLLVVNADNTLTLSGTVIRDVCQYTETRTFTTCSNGFQFQRGNRVILTDNHRLFNLKADIDRENTFTGSGRITSDQTTQTWLNPTSLTTAEIAAVTYKQTGDIVWDETVGIVKYYDGSSWLSIANTTGALVNATESVRGVIELATVAEQGAATATGSTAAPLVVQAKYLVKTSSGSVNENKIPILEASGFLSPSLGGTGSGGHIPWGIILGGTTTGSKLESVDLLGTTNQVLTSNGAGTKPSFEDSTLLNLKVTLAESTATGSTNTDEVFADENYTIPANTLAQGEVLHIKAAGTYRLDAGTLLFKLKLGATEMGEFTITTLEEDESAWAIDAWIVVRSIGATGKLIAGGTIGIQNIASNGSGSALSGDGSGASTAEQSIDTTASNVLQMSAEFSNSDANHNFQVETLTVFKTNS